MNKTILTLITICLTCQLAFCQVGNASSQGLLHQSSDLTHAITTSPSKIQDLAILGKVWGFLKYHHPSVDEGTYNWDQELVDIFPSVLEAKTAVERNHLLERWVDGLGMVEVGFIPAQEQATVKLSPDLDWINVDTLGNTLVEKLRLIQKAKRKDVHHYIGYVSGIQNPLFKNEEPYSSVSFPSVELRLLALYRYWNIIHYYFPYKNQTDEPWSKVLEKFIPKFLEANSELEYKLAVLSLIAHVQDTHANIWSQDSVLSAYRGKNYSAILLSFIEDKVVVTGNRIEELGRQTGLKQGDVIESVDGKPIAALLKERLPFTPASNYSTQLRDFTRDLLCSNDTAVTVTYSRDSNLMTATIRCYSPNQVTLPSRMQRKDTCFRLLTPDIAYLYLGNIKNEYLPKLMPEVLKTKGLIIDLRCYPSEFMVFTLGTYLLAEPTPFVKFARPNLETPGLFTFTNPLKVGRYNSDYYKGKVVVLVNELTQSQAEYTAMAFRAAPDAKVIGSTTSGADGNVSEIFLPGGIRTLISGIGVYYPDGRETQRIGIIPDIEVKPTIKGIAEGRDEVLEKAIELINNR